MEDEELKNVVYNVSKDKDGYKFISYLIEHSRCNNPGANFENEKIEYYNRGMKDFGRFISNLIQKYNFPKYIEIEKERSADL